MKHCKYQIAAWLKYFGFNIRIYKKKAATKTKTGTTGRKYFEDRQMNESGIVALNCCRVITSNGNLNKRQEKIHRITKR